MSINQRSGGRRFVEGLHQALFSFRLARQNVIYKAKRKLSLISGNRKRYNFDLLWLIKGKFYIGLVTNHRQHDRGTENVRPCVKLRPTLNVEFHLCQISVEK